MKLKFFILLAGLFVVAAQALSQDSLNRKVLEEVVVTGQHQPQSVRNSVYQVKVISAARIQRQAATKLQDVLSNELNIRFSQDLATGGSDISMLGLSGQNVKILLDGAPLVGRQGTSNEININQIDISTIERIEIIEGPMSVVYGADALAGVINIITKKPGRQALRLDARLQEETAGKEYGLQQGIHNQSVALSWNYKNWLIGGGFTHNRFNGWRGDTTGRELSWHKKDQLLANALLGYRTQRWNLYYRFDGLDEIITNPANPVGSQPATDQDYMTNRLMQQLQGQYRVGAQLSLSGLFSYTHFTRQLYSTLYYPNGDVRVSTAPGAHSLNTFDGLTARLTAVYQPWAKISLQPGVDINSESGSGERLQAGTQTITDYAFFVSSEISAARWISIRPGLRFLKNSVYQAPPVIPSFNSKIKLGKQVDLRLAYARGFRAPSLRELYFDFRDASHDILGNEQLEAETSNSFNSSLQWQILQKQQLNLKAGLTAFYNDVRNQITYIQDAADPRITTYGNVDRFKTRGITLGGEMQYGSLRANIGGSYIDYYNQWSASDKTLPAYTHSLEANGSVGWSLSRIGLDLNLFYKYTGKRPFYQEELVNAQNTLVKRETAGYHWVDISAGKSINRWLQLQAGVRNLANVTNLTSTAVGGGVHGNGGVRPIGYGRSFFAALIFHYTRKGRSEEAN